MKVNQNQDGKYNEYILSILKQDISLRLLELYIVYFDLDKSPFSIKVFNILLNKIT